MADSATLFRNAVHSPKAVLKDEDENEAGLPSPIEGEYTPYAMPANKGVHAVHFLKPNGTVTSFQYVHLDSHSQFTPECITLRFIGYELATVRIHGRNLWLLYDYLHQHRMRWVAEATKDFAADGVPIVSRVEIG